MIRNSSKTRIRKLNEKHIARISSSNVHGDKAFATEQKIRQFKKLLFATTCLDKQNGNQTHANKPLTKETEKFKQDQKCKNDTVPEEIRAKELASEEFRQEYRFQRL